MMRPLYESIDPVLMGEYRRSLAIGEEYAKRLLASVRNQHAEEIVKWLVWNYPSHGFVIDRTEARALRLPVVDLMPSQDNALVEVLLEMIDNEVSYHGFIPATKRTTVAKRVSRKQPSKVATSRPQKPHTPVAVA
jgi:hypothetical protein